MKLEIVVGNDKGKAFPLQWNEELTIGRDTNCSACLSDVESSRCHARVVCENGQIVLEDLNSTNGTFVNGNIVFRTILAENDEVLIGETVLRAVDLPVDPIDTTVLDVRDEEKTVVVSLHHEEADLVAGRDQVADTAEMAIENKILKKVCEISQIVATQGDTRTVLVSILDNMQEVLSADTACLLIWSEDAQDWVIRATSTDLGTDDTVSVSRTIIKEALDEGKAILSKDPLSDERFDPSKSIMYHGISSALCSPVKIGSHFRGVLVLDRRNRKKAFRPIDLRLTATVGNILGLLLEKEMFEIESKQKARLAVIGEVIAGLAHYTKNIITGLRISIYSLTMLLKNKQYDSAQECLVSISSQERRIAELVLNMLSYAKDRKPARSELHVKDVIGDVVTPYKQHLTDKGIQLEFNCHADAPAIRAEEQSLHRCFLNLFVNAMDTFRSEGEDRKLIRISVDPVAGNGGVDIRFYDTGSGIPPDKLDKIFAVFYSTKGSQGTGLGLAVVHKIIQEHGGNIYVDSIENEWTEFRIVLPPGDAT